MGGERDGEARRLDAADGGGRSEEIVRGRGGGGIRLDCPFEVGGPCCGFRVGGFMEHDEEVGGLVAILGLGIFGEDFDGANSSSHPAAPDAGTGKFSLLDFDAPSRFKAGISISGAEPWATVAFGVVSREPSTSVPEPCWFLWLLSCFRIALSSRSSVVEDCAGGCMARGSSLGDGCRPCSQHAADGDQEVGGCLYSRYDTEAIKAPSPIQPMPESQLAHRRALLL